MYDSSSAKAYDGAVDDAAREDVPTRETRNAALEPADVLIYLDPRAFTRDCIGRWLRTSLSGFDICSLSDPEQIETAPIAHHRIRAVILNAGPEPMSSTAVAPLVSRVSEILPEIPVAVLSDREDPTNIREAFSRGVRGYIPTSLGSQVAIEALRLVCVGGTYAPAVALLSEADHPSAPEGEPLIAGFTQRQSQILDCLQRGMANKLIAYELNMCESTVKVHIRNIMKKLNATNRTQVAYLTRGFFECAPQYQRA
jgi:DNA-binding NarL/FixJ family response regulator